MKSTFSLALAVALATASVAHASATINVGNHFLLPNTNGGPANSFDVVISGNDTNIQGFVLAVQVGDGGPIPGQILGYVGVPGPRVITGAGSGPGINPGSHGTGPFDISEYPGWGGPGYLFAANNTGVADTNIDTSTNPPGLPFGGQILYQGTTTNSGFVNDVGGVTLVRLSFDTTGFSAGTWNLILSDTVAGKSDLLGLNPDGTVIIPLSITDGTITILSNTPEPGSATLGLFAIAGLIAVAYRRSRKMRG